MRLTYEEIETIRAAMRKEFGPLTDVAIEKSRHQTAHQYYVIACDGSPDAKALKWDGDDYSGPVMECFGLYRDEVGNLILDAVH